MEVSGERRYDGDSLTYSPDGTIKQLEYAAKAVNNGNLCVGLTCKDAVVSAGPGGGIIVVHQW